VIGTTAPAAPATIASSRRGVGGVREWARGRGSFILGLTIIGLLILVSALAPILAPHDPTAIHARDGLQPPSATYPLGTDNLGRDILSRIVYAARTSLLVALGSMLVSAFVGVPLGLIAGYAAGKVDSVIMRLLDAILAFPVILLAILVVATLGTETINLVFTIGFVFIPYFTRLVRAHVLALKEREFVEASRASGADDRHLVARVILPNILSPVVVQASLTMSLAVLIEATLSFLGLGVQEPTPAWGSMLQQSQLYLRQAPWFVLSPGICIFLSVLAFNLVGDGLRDLVDVSSRRR
jgi:ABC-type dipeptide/oligopeptide/nickel transport system permease subunit